TYSISGGADSAKFSINSSTGVLTFASAPDFESPTDAGGNNVYDVIVEVSDGTNVDTQAIAVTVTALNDNNPVITSDGGGASAAVNVAENSTAVTTVTATDADAGSTLTYSISGGVDAAKFSINSSTGVLTFASAPDFESPTDTGGNNVYDVIVQVSDGTNTDTQSIAVTVTAVNDNNPVITSDGGGASAAVNVAENSTAVTTVTATDADAGSTLTYSIIGGADAAKFSVNSSTGALTFVSAPDFENPTDAGADNVYDVTVQVSDGANTDSQAIAVTVTDVSDNTPVITSDGGGASATRNVAENGTAVTTVTATDVDSGTTLTYSIIGGADSARFSINASTGVLTFVSAPDYESPTDAGGNNVYDVTIRVSDGANTDTQAIAVTVTDANDSAPVITSDGGGASANKNVAENGTAVTAVTANDADTGTTLTYSISGGADSAKFSINSSTGVLTFASAPDFESPTDAGGNNVYDVIVEVSDGTNTDTQAIAVTVTDVNDNAPVITSDGGGTSATKNVAENGTAVTTVTATDLDTGTTLTYSITGGADAARFSINSSTGVLTFVSAPDYESPTDAGGNNVYDITVLVSDGTNTDTQAIAITVTDMNDHAPVISSDGGAASSTKNMAENATAVTTVTATDVDTGTTLTYSITGGADAARFSINSSTGVLTFVSAPDYESPTDAGGNNVYDVTVQVSDGTNTDTQAIAVTITDVNDNAPVITSDGGGASATRNVAENSTAVTTIAATDADNGTTMTYSITGGADASKFSINSSTGVLTFVSAPNYEAPTDAGGNNVYDVTVQVSDGTNTDTQAIAVTVTGVNESPTAQITLGNYNATEKVGLTLHGTGIQIADPDALSGTVQAQLSVGHGVLNVSAGNAGISITGSGSNTVSITGTLAQINQLLSGSSTGTISYANNHDAPSPTDTLTLTVNDLGNTGAGTALSDSATATINVTAVNDTPVMSAITLTANAAPSASWSSGTLLNGSSDPDGDTLAVRVLQGPQHGTLSISGSGQVTYTTNAGYVGSDSFSYVAFDGQADSSNVRVMSIQASSPLVDMGPGSNTSNTDSPPPKVDTTNKNDSDTSTPKPGKVSEPKPGREEPIVVAPPSETDVTESTETGSVGALLHQLTNSAWTPGRFSDTFGTARQIFFAPPAGTYVTSTMSTVANAPSVMQLLDLIKPNLEHAPDINLSLTPLSSVTHALPAGRLADADTADNDSGSAPIRLTKIATYSSGLSLSIGTIWWTARMSGLVTSALISTPAWRSLDPLPVVTSPTDEQDDEHDGDSRLGDREVEHLFDGDKPVEQDMPIIQ
ncbi:MAG: cadherin domain-containing protein, partial [Aquabacterium sp.]|uniref:beta strand repeat-containing protein n=1 Tax=Aquabacterium sp. TaxID=1872578 RepID=UPI0025BF6AFC